MTFIYSSRVVETSILLEFPLHIEPTAKGGRTHRPLVDVLESKVIV